ncbi:MAG: hypothetical protein Q9186_001475 [Xanthomendoza sp. 1 TL-2023]
MLLALECLKKGVLKEKNVTKHELGRIVAPPIRRCSEWFIPKASPYLKGESSWVATVHIARDELHDLYPVSVELVSNRANRNANNHRHCRMLWQLLRCYIELGGTDPVIKPKEVKLALTKLEKGRPPISPEVQAIQTRVQRSRAGARPGIGSNSVGLLANLPISDEDRQRYLNRLDRLVGVAPRSGPLASPVTLWSQNLQTLTGEEWLDDTVIEAYLSLVCHHGNEHFQLAKNGQTTKAGSPKWHAWSLYLLNDNHGTSAAWPPAVYPEGKVEEVEQHFFPYHSVNHWVLLHLYHSGAFWYTDFYSSIKNQYDHVLDDLWPKVERTMMEISQGRLDLSTAIIQIAATQPFQNNSSDCGVLALMVARGLMEGWKMESILSKHCPSYRSRMIVELEKWSLD